MIREKRVRTSLFVLIGLCLSLGLVETLQQHVGNVLRGDSSTSLLHAFETNFLPWLPALALLPLIVLLAERFPLDGGRWRGSLPVHLLAMATFSFLHQYAAALILSVIYPPTISFFFLLVKLLTIRFAIDALVYWTGIGVTWAARVSQAAREREQAAVRLEATLAETRLGALRDQLNPHFLFNTLNAISTLALRDDRSAVVTSLGALSDLLRRSLDTKRVQEVPLAEELASAERFLEIQQLRFSDRLTVTRQIPADLGDVAVPTMILQPVLENAFQHGVARVPGPVGVGITARQADGQLVLEVTDTGPGLDRTDLRERIGLGNTRERLSHLYGDRGTLMLLNGVGGDTTGTTARIIIPFRRLGTGGTGDT